METQLKERIQLAIQRKQITKVFAKTHFNSKKVHFMREPRMQSFITLVDTGDKVKLKDWTAMSASLTKQKRELKEILSASEAVLPQEPKAKRIRLGQPKYQRRVSDLPDYTESIGVNHTRKFLDKKWTVRSLDVDRLFTMNKYVIESNQTRHVPVLRNLDKHIIKIIEHNRKDNMNTKLFIEFSFEMQLDDDADGNPVFKIYHASSRNT
jgi:hypothetical protein